ncbi:amidase [Mycobacterium aquaticum]|uniref:amidase n=1 Tax=Mycobacterium aquaticum TaxID=1927124 RepID=A0A1X0BBK9_9MYCO|nr:amidase [Mycobacterium aquaticum]ORA39216.1 hypothetical protein BST13_02830 [Mycobacterium aquaticum]
MSSTQLSDWCTVEAAGDALRKGETTAVELLEQVIDRLAATEPHVHAYASLDLDRARRDAKRADRCRVRGPLHGIPFGVKDVFAVAGLPTACGSKAFADNITHRDAVVVAALRRAGAVLIGKHVTHELTCGVDEAPTRNPHAPAYYPGGSSCGSAASVAVGSALFAIGTDAAGSVRIPASATGTVGFKPTRGLLSTRGVVRGATAPSIDHAGILARSVTDIGLILDALASEPISRNLLKPPTMRLGVVRVGGLKLDREVGVLFEAALDRLAALGATLISVDLPELGDAPAAVATYFAAELAEGNRGRFSRRCADYHPAVRDLITVGLNTSDVDRGSAQQVRTRINAALSGALQQEGLDAFVSPTITRPPPLLAELNPVDDLSQLVAFTCAFNLTGQPAISVPCGVTAQGLPVGLQIAGHLHDDRTVLRIASAYAPPVVSPPPVT